MISYLITGANKGIGFALAKRILTEKKDAFVFLGSRNVENGRKALSALSEELDGVDNRMKVICIDVGNEASVNEAQAEVKLFIEGHSRLSQLDVLVNNAGVFGNASLRSILRVNVNGVHRVTTKFHPLLNPNGRIVNISSSMGPDFVRKCNEIWKQFFTKGEISWNDIDSLIEKIIDEYETNHSMSQILVDMGLEKSYIRQQSRMAYGLSKALCNSLTLLQAKAYSNMKVNACMPGFIFTDMTRHYASGDENTAKQMGMKSVEESTIAPFYLACDPNLNKSGCYYRENGALGSFI